MWNNGKDTMAWINTNGADGDHVPCHDSITLTFGSDSVILHPPSNLEGTAIHMGNADKEGNEADERR